MAGVCIDRGENLLKSCVKELQSCVEYVQQYSENKQQQFAVLKDIARQYSEINIVYDKARQAREATSRYFDNQEKDCTEEVQDVYKKYWEELPNNATFENHEIWLKIKKAVEGKNAESLEENSASEESSGEIEDDNGNIDEGFIPSQFEPPVDPITKLVIKNPCRNKKCGHIYEFSTVMNHLKNIRQKKVKPMCPYIGCTNSNMRSSFIVRDNALQEQIQNYIANTSRRLNDSSSSSQSNVVL